MFTRRLNYDPCIRRFHFDQFYESLKLTHMKGYRQF